jgi:hypothetical protein
MILTLICILWLFATTSPANLRFTRDDLRYWLFVNVPLVVSWLWLTPFVPRAQYPALAGVLICQRMSFGTWVAEYRHGLSLKGRTYLCLLLMGGAVLLGALGFVFGEPVVPWIGVEATAATAIILATRVPMTALTPNARKGLVTSMFFAGTASGTLIKNLGRPYAILQGVWMLAAVSSCILVLIAARRTLKGSRP